MTHKDYVLAGLYVLALLNFAMATWDMIKGRHDRAAAIYARGAFLLILTRTAK